MNIHEGFTYLTLCLVIGMVVGVGMVSRNIMDKLDEILKEIKK